MGREAQLMARVDGQPFEAKAVLEAHELILRGPALRRRLPLVELQELALQGEALCFCWAQQPWRLELGAAEAAKWLKKIQAGPPSLASKLGISAAQPAAVFGPVEADAPLAEALLGARTDSLTEATVLLALVLDPQGLEAALALHARMPCRAVWLVYQKGPLSVFGDGPIRSHLRARGYRDNKSCAVSDRLTATRYLKP